MLKHRHPCTCIARLSRSAANINIQRFCLAHRRWRPQIHFHTPLHSRSEPEEDEMENVVFQTDDDAAATSRDRAGAARSSRGVYRRLSAAACRSREGCSRKHARPTKLQPARCLRRPCHVMHALGPDGHPKRQESGSVRGLGVFRPGFYMMVETTTTAT